MLKHIELKRLCGKQKTIRSEEESGVNREPIRFIIPVAPITKKNHGEIVVNKNTGKRMFVPSKQYRSYSKDAGWFIPKLHIGVPVNVRAIYYKKDRRKADLANLHQALLDIMKDNGAIEDDNYTIVASMDGSRVMYDRENPRTEVEITFLGGDDISE